MADFTMDINLNAGGNLVSVIDRATEATKRYSRATETATRSTTLWSRATASLLGNLQAMAIGRLTDQIFRSAGAALEMAESYTRLGNAVRQVSESNAIFNSNMNEIFALANRTRSAVEDVAKSFQRFTLATQEQGRSQEEIIRMIETYNKIGLISGQTTRELSQAAIQFGQAMASGRLQGDEFRTQMEAMPQLMRRIANTMGVTVGELKQLSSEGKITADVMARTLLESATEVDAAFARMNITVETASQVLRNNLIAAIGELNEELGVTDNLASVMLRFGESLEGLTQTNVIQFFIELARVIGLVSKELTDLFTTKIPGTEKSLLDLVMAATPALSSFKAVSEAAGVAADALGGIGSEITEAQTIEKIDSLRKSIQQLKDEIGPAAVLAERYRTQFGEDLARQFAQGAIGGEQFQRLFLLKDQLAEQKELLNNFGLIRSDLQRFASAQRQYSDRWKEATKSLKDHNKEVKKATEDTPQLRSALARLVHLGEQEAMLFKETAKILNSEYVPALDRVNRELEELFERDPDGIFGGAAEEANDLVDAFQRWSDVLVRLDQNWSNMLSTILAGLSQVVNLTDQGPLGLVDMLGVGATGIGIGGSLGAAFGGNNQTGSLVGGALGGILGGQAVTTSIGSAIASALGIGGSIAGPIGTVVGAGVGSFIGSLFGGSGRGPSPEISIGGSGTRTGQVAGTQGISPFGSFGIRNPRGADDFAAFAQVAQLVASTDRRIAAFLTAPQVEAVRLARGGFEITMDSDEQAEFNAAIGAFFKNSIDAVSTELGDIFSELTGNLRIDAGEMAEIAVGLFQLNAGLEAIGLTVTGDFIAAFGDVQSALSEFGAFMQRFFSREELLGIGLGQLQEQLVGSFGDIVDEYGVSLGNFREAFEAAAPEGEELARWIQLGNLLGEIDDITQSLVQIERERVDGLMAEADAMMVAADAMERELEIRIAITDNILGNLDINLAFNRALESNLDTFRRTRAEFVNALGTWDLTTSGLRDMESAARSFQQAALAIFADIQSLRGTVAGGQSLLDQITLAGLGPQGRFEFFRDRAQTAAQGAADAESPAEADRLLRDAISAATQAWNQLTPEQQAFMGGDFSQWVNGILGLGETIGNAWEQYLREQGVDLQELSQSPLEASAATIEGAAQTMRAAAEIFRETVDRNDDITEEFRGGVRTFVTGVNDFYLGATGQPVVNAA